jgi:hypothetical protein
MQQQHGVCLLRLQLPVGPSVAHVALMLSCRLLPLAGQPWRRWQLLLLLLLLQVQLILLCGVCLLLLLLLVMCPACMYGLLLLTVLLLLYQSPHCFLLCCFDEPVVGWYVVLELILQQRQRFALDRFCVVTRMWH